VAVRVALQITRARARRVAQVASPAAVEAVAVAARRRAALVAQAALAA